MPATTRSNSASMKLAAVMLLIIASQLIACGSYAIKGRVVRGPIASVEVVDKDDPRLREPNPSGGGAVIQAVLEPNTPSEMRSLGRHVSNGQGWFTIPVDAFGSGLLEYEGQLIVRRQGHQGAMGTFMLPGKSERVLVTLPLGRDTLVVPERFLDRALKDAEPYFER